MPFVNWIKVEVEFAKVLPMEVGVNGNAKFWKSVPSIAATTEPALVTLRSEPPGMFVIASAEVVAFVAKRLPALSAVEDAYGNCDAATVDDEKKTPWVKMELVVAAVVVPKLLKNAKMEVPAVATPQPNCPPFQVKKFPAWHVVSDAP
jgi:hypothetical protein